MAGQQEDSKRNRRKLVICGVSSRVRSRVSFSFQRAPERPLSTANMAPRGLPLFSACPNLRPHAGEPREGWESTVAWRMNIQDGRVSRPLALPAPGSCCQWYREWCGVGPVGARTCRPPLESGSRGSAPGRWPLPARLPAPRPRFRALLP